MMNQTEAFVIPLYNGDVDVNRSFSDALLAHCVRMDGFTQGNTLEVRRVCLYIGANRTHLFFQARIELPPSGTPALDPYFDPWRIPFEDSFMMRLNPCPDEEDTVSYFSIMNGNGGDSYFAYTQNAVSALKHYEWWGSYIFRNTMKDGFWVLEIAVPMASLFEGCTVTDRVWSINASMLYHNPWMHCYFNDDHQAPRFIFTENSGTLVAHSHLASPHSGSFDAEIALTNTGHAPRHVVTQCTLTDGEKVLREWHETTVLAACGKTCLRFTHGPLRPTYQMRIQVDDEGRTIYRRSYTVGEVRPDVWRPTVANPGPLRFHFAYRPYSHTLDILTDVSGIPNNGALKNVNYTVTTADESETLLTFDIPGDAFTDCKQESRQILSGLDGEYIIKGRALCGDEVYTEEKRFVRNRYPWERNSMGRSRMVYAPFTPMLYRDGVVHTVLKAYRLGASGLPESIRTEDTQRQATRELLTRPVTLYAAAGGREQAVEFAPYTVKEAADDRIITQAKSGGRLNAMLNLTFEYDGLIKTELTLLPYGDKTVDALYCDISLSPESATMFHAASDGCRISYTNRAPAKAGERWDATHLRTSAIPKNFCPYIFVGDEKRGLCWFAENGKGWGWDPQTPNLALIREGDRLLLRLYLINQPTVIREPRTIVFGLMATPVKPKAEGWRHRWLDERFNMLGCDIHWFALGDCGSVYPANKDLKLWEPLKRAFQAPLSDDEIEAFVAYGEKHFIEKAPVYQQESFRECARTNLKERVGIKPIFYYNRSSSGVSEELETFADEWGLYDYNEEYRHFREARERYVIPTESFVDYILYWYKIAFEVAGNQGVYTDNNFFISIFNRAMCGAYDRGDGKVVPSTGVWALRDMAKRTFVMMNELGMDPITVAHMTSVQALPILSFYTAQYDWEWHYSEGDAQDRYTHEYLAQLSTGEHAGTWPILLHDQGDLQDDDRTRKTIMAVSLVYELTEDRYIWHVHPSWGRYPNEEKYYKMFREPMLSLARQPDCEAYRFWDERPAPIRLACDGARSIVYALPGREALVAIAGFADADEPAEIDFLTAEMGFGPEVAITNVETGEAVPAAGHKFLLKQHDLVMFSITPCEEGGVCE